MMSLTSLEDGKQWNDVYNLLRKKYVYIQTIISSIMLVTKQFCFHVIDIFGNIWKI